MTRTERVHHLKALSARKDVATVAHNLGRTRDEADRMADLSDRIEDVISEKAAHIRDLSTTGQFSAHFVLVQALQAELEKNHMAETQAKQNIQSLQQHLSSLSELQRLHTEKAKDVRRSHLREQELKAEYV